MKGAHGLFCICLYTLLGMALGYAPLVTSVKWAAPCYQKNAADILLLAGACKTTCPLVAFSERKLQNTKTHKKQGEDSSPMKSTQGGGQKRSRGGRQMT